MRWRETLDASSLHKRMSVLVVTEVPGAVAVVGLRLVWSSREERGNERILQWGDVMFFNAEKKRENEVKN